MDWQWIGKLEMDWWIGDGLVDWSRIDMRLADWQWICQGLANGDGLADWRWIGRFVTDW